MRSRDTIHSMEQAVFQQSVLIVEDDQLLSGLLAVKMSKKFNTLAAGTGEAALEILKSNTPDIILLDILLPGIDGFELLRRVKTDPKTAAIPVVILSNLGEDADKAKGKELGAEEFVVKVTLLPDEVVSLVESVCARHRAVK